MNATGESVLLRAMGPEDAGALWGWNHDAEVMRWMDENYPQTLVQVQRWLTERPRNDYGDVLFGIEAIGTGDPGQSVGAGEAIGAGGAGGTGGRLIGLVRLHGAEPEFGIAELDIYLGDKAQWGKGYATDAVRTACRYGFDKMRLHKITLTVVTENEAAHHVYRKVGFVDEGRLRQSFRRNGTWLDKFTMGLLADELR